MSSIGKKMLQAAAGAGGAAVGSYIAVAHKNAPRFTLLDHTTAGTLSTATTVTVGSGDGFSAQFSPDGNFVAVTTGGANQLTLLDTSSPGSASVSSSINAGVVSRDLSFSPDGTRIALISRDTNDIKVFAISGGTLSLDDTFSLSPTLDDGTISVDFSPDGNFLCCYGGTLAGVSKLVILSYSSGAGLALSDTETLVGTSSSRGAVRFSPDGTQVAVSSGSRLNLFNVSSGLFGSSTSVTLASGTATGLAWNPRNNQVVFLGSGTNQILAYDTTSSPSLSANGSFTFPENSFAFGFSPDGNYFAASVDAALTRFYLLDSSVDGSFTLLDTLDTDLLTTGARLSFSPY